MYMRPPADEFSDVPLTGSVKTALLIASVGTLYLGILPARILDWTASAAVNFIR
jgi:NADH:ubiquinone oxidoreductase subunit 2 (subunit N)